MQISTLNKENPLSGFPKNSRWIYPPALDQAYQVPYFPSLHRRYSLVNSSATAGTRAKTTITPHSRKDGKCVLNIGCRNGRLTAASISTTDSPTAYCMYLFDNIPSLKMDCLSDRTVYARNSSHRLSVTNAMVSAACTSTPLQSCCTRYASGFIPAGTSAPASRCHSRPTTNAPNTTPVWAVVWVGSPNRLARL